MEPVVDVVDRAGSIDGERPGLDLEDPEQVMPLAFGDLAACPVPFELSENDVLRRRQVESARPRYRPGSLAGLVALLPGQSDVLGE